VSEGTDSGRPVSLLSAAGWVLLAEGVAAGSAVMATVLAARVVSPAEFGLFGIVTLAVNVLTSLGVSGFEQALVQRSDDIKSYLNVVWTWHVCRGLLIAGVLCAAAPLLVRFYGEPRLLAVTLASAIAPALTGLQNIGPVFFSRKLEFGRLFAIRTVQSFVSLAVYVPCIFFFRNVWALVLGAVASSAAQVAVSYVAHPYRPRFEVDRAKLRELLQYGRWITSMALLGFVVTQGDDVFVSKYFGVAAFGVYQLAYSISNLPATQVTHVISKVSFPAYARAQGNPAEVARLFVGVAELTMVISSAAAVVIFAFMPDVVRYVIGPKWAAAVPLVRVLVVAGLVRSFAALAGALFDALGAPRLNLLMNLPRLIVLVVVLWPLSAYFGLVGACAAVLASIAATLPGWLWGVRQVAPVAMRSLVRSQLAPIVSSALLCASIVGLGRVLPSTLAGAVAHLLLALIVWAAALRVAAQVFGYDVRAALASLRGRPSREPT
jgi:O-antigen/teichoic acid export membrane protein